MKTILRIYSWLMFPVIASLHIAMQLPVFVLNIINNFTHGRFYGREIPDEYPFNVLPDFANRLIYAIAEPFEVCWQNLRALNGYKF